MKRKYESVSTSSRTLRASKKDLVAEARQKFQKGMSTSLPARRLREFYSEDKIKEVEQIERKKVFDDFYPLVMRFRGKNMGEMVTELDTGIQKVTEAFLKVNQHHKEEIHLFIGKMMNFLCEEHELWLESQLSLNPDMGQRKRKTLLQNEKTRIIKFFSDQCNQWNPEIAQEQISKLEEKVTRIQGVIEEKYILPARTTTSNSNASDSVPIAEKEKFDKMAERILKVCDELKDYWNEDSKNLKLEEGDNEEERCSYLEGIVEQVEKALEVEEYNRFSNRNYQETYDRLNQVLVMAIKALSLAESRPTRVTARKSTGGIRMAPQKQRGWIAATYVNGNDALMWQRAFELDMRYCLPNQRASHQFEIDCQGFEFWLSKMIVKTSCKELIRQSSKWKVEGFSSVWEHQKLVKGLEVSLGVDYKNIRGPLKLFTERLCRIWKPRNWKAESDAEGDDDDGSSSDQTSDSQSESE